MAVRFFRPHRELYADSMNEKIQVEGVKDIVTYYENDRLLNGYFKNIRISPASRRPHRDHNDEWGTDTYLVVADFDGYTGQCIGMANFCEE